MIKMAELAYVKYRDHVLFKDADPDAYKPFVREAVGWLDHEGKDYVRLIWERFAEPAAREESRQRATGLVIFKSAIMELKRLSTCLEIKT